jgi:transcriptional regulator with XRE-family HTH domain
MTGVPPACARLSAELRALRERSGLTLGALAARTPYSRSAWHRYLTSRALPPWPAVLHLAELAGEPEPLLRALWELADREWSGRSRTASVPAANQPPPAAVRPEPVEATAPEPPPAAGPDAAHAAGPAAGRAAGTARRPGFKAAVTVAATAAVCAALAVLVALDAWSKPAGHPSSAGFHVACTGAACDGKDPQTTLCGVEPDTVLHRQVPGGFGLEIRYNPMCRAAWARVWNVSRGDRLSFSAAGQPVQSVTDTRSGGVDPFVYTPLAGITGGHRTLRACVTLHGSPRPECYTALSP